MQTLPDQNPELVDDKEVGGGDTGFIMSKLDSLIDKLTVEEITPWTYCRAIWCYNRHLRFVMHRKNDTNACRLCNCCSKRRYFTRFHRHDVKHLPPDAYNLPGEAWV